MKLVAKTPIYEITKIVKPTKARLFKNLEVGSTIQLSVSVGSLGSNRGQTYAPSTFVRNMETDEVSSFSFNEFGNRINNFELVELKA